MTAKIVDIAVRRFNRFLKGKLIKHDLHPKTVEPEEGPYQSYTLDALEDAYYKRLEKENEYINVIVYYKQNFRNDEWEEILFRDASQANLRKYRGGVLDIPLLRRCIHDVKRGFTDLPKKKLPPTPVKELEQILNTSHEYTKQRLFVSLKALVGR